MALYFNTTTSTYADCKSVAKSTTQSRVRQVLRRDGNTRRASKRLPSFPPHLCVRPARALSYQSEMFLHSTFVLIANTRFCSAASTIPPTFSTNCTINSTRMRRALRCSLSSARRLSVKSCSISSSTDSSATSPRWQCYNKPVPFPKTTFRKRISIACGRIRCNRLNK